MKSNPSVAAVAAALCLVMGAAQAALPFQPQYAAAYDANAHPEGTSRLKVTVAAASATSQQVSFGPIVVCSTTACFQTPPVQVTGVPDTRNGKSTVIADVLVPNDPIRSVHLIEVAGSDVRQADLVLDRPLEFIREIRGEAEVFVGLRSEEGPRGRRFAAIGAAATVSSPELAPVHFLPGTRTSVQLPKGVVWSIPANASKRPHVFIVKVHDTGRQYPRVDIYPDEKFDNSSRLTIPELPAKDEVTRPEGSPPRTPAPTPFMPDGRRGESPKGGTRDLQIKETGVTSGAASKEASDTSFTAEANAHGWTNCSAAMADAANKEIIAQGLVPTGTVELTWCEDIPPHVHIAITNMSDPRERISIVHMPEVELEGMTWVPLRRVDHFARHGQVVLNGFNWTGGLGFSDFEYGLAEGYVMANRRLLGDNRAGGGTGFLPAVTGSSGLKRVMHASAGNPVTWMDASFVGGWGGTNYVSSSTSIVKDGTCASDTTVDRWSAVGTTPDGRFVFMSSAGNGTTSAAEMCPVLQALGVNNAIRMDGGRSASMVISGELRNPLPPWYSIGFGDSRRVAYALRVAYEGW